MSKRSSAEWIELLQVADPIDFLCAFIDANTHLSRKQLDKKLRRLKDRAKINQELDDVLRLDAVIDRKLSPSELWRVHVCTNHLTLTPREVVTDVRRAYQTTSARLGALYALRTFAKRFYPEIPEEWVQKLALHKSEIDRLKVKYQRDLISRADQPIQLSALTLWRKLSEWIRSDDPARTACALVMCTGRRTVEIGTMGKFKLPNECHAVKSKFWVAFTGQAKKRKIEGETSRAKVWYDIPTFAEPKLVFAAMKRLREALETPSDRKRLWDIEVPDLIRKRFGPEFTARSFRAVYAVLSHTLFRPMVAVNRWTQLILGHTNILISQAYLNVYLYDLDRMGEVGGTQLGLVA